MCMHAVVSFKLRPEAASCCCFALQFLLRDSSTRVAECDCRFCVYAHSEFYRTHGLFLSFCQAIATLLLRDARGNSVIITYYSTKFHFGFRRVIVPSSF